MDHVGGCSRQQELEVSQMTLANILRFRQPLFHCSITFLCGDGNIWVPLILGLLKFQYPMSVFSYPSLL